MRRTTLFAADLEPLRFPGALRRDLGTEYRGDAGPSFSAMALRANPEAAVLDAANRNGHAARTLTAAMSDLYPNGSNQ